MSGGRLADAGKIDLPGAEEASHIAQAIINHSFKSQRGAIDAGAPADTRSIGQLAVDQANAKFNAQRPSTGYRSEGHCPVETFVYWSATAVFAVFVVSLLVS